MKKLYLTIAIFLLAISLSFAQFPQAISYQIIARDNLGNILIDQLLNLKISIIYGSSIGSAVYIEKQSVSTNQFGLANVKIGLGEIVSGTFSAIDWSKGNYFIKVESSLPTGGYQILGTTSLLAVPYALYSLKSETAGPTGPTGPTGPMLKGLNGTPGPTGPTGSTGLHGITGPAGINGINGVNGITGAKGAQGIQGITGQSGPAGATGFQGIQGIAGPVGATGAKGITGLTGPTGINGINGLNGLNGITGPQGAQGIQGIVGQAGIAGAKGITGATGLQGAQGIQGIIGPVGVAGAKGATGATGSTGINGLNGITGVTGATGPAGINGKNGLTGATGTQGIQGITGPTGVAGSKGVTGTAGINGLNGATGATGPAGTNGINGLKGITGATGLQGIQGITGSAGSGPGALPYGLTGQTLRNNGTGWEISNQIYNNGNYVGIGTTNPTSILDVNGMISANCIKLRGGCDIAEPFNVKSQSVYPGLVLCIDPENPGRLKISENAYDKKVAGIVSGANNVKPGLVMNQDDVFIDGKFPVALTGRVYCYADATHNSINPGDLLTTSDTPGYAMKATDFSKTQGAVIGKAMTGLKEGKGMVLVLVTLQ